MTIITKKIIATHPNFKNLGEELSTKLNINLVKINFQSFPDSWPNYFIENVKEDIEGAEVTYIGDFSTPELVFENYTIIRGILDYCVDKIRIIMPFFPVGTMERINIKGEIATAKYFADIFSNIPSGSKGKTSIHILDIHALSTRFFFNTQNVNIDLHTSMSLIKNKIDKNTVIVFPDDGAKKRFNLDFKGYEKIVCAKTRIGDKREIIITEGTPKNKDLIIIDDLIQSGGTIIETARVLKKLGAKKISAFATHGVFPNNSYIKLASNLDKLYVTNSIPKDYSEVENIEILNIGEIIEKLITKK